MEVYSKKRTVQVSARGQRVGRAVNSFGAAPAMAKLRLCVSRGTGGKRLSRWIGDPKTATWGNERESAAPAVGEVYGADQGDAHKQKDGGNQREDDHGNLLEIHQLHMQAGFQTYIMYFQ